MNSECCGGPFWFVVPKVISLAGVSLANGTVWAQYLLLFSTLMPLKNLQFTQYIKKNPENKQCWNHST